MKALRRLWESVRCAFRPNISRERAIELARQECERRGQPWEGPIGVHGYFLYYSVVTHDDWLGGDIWIAVDKRDGHIRGFGRWPRC